MVPPPGGRVRAPPGAEVQTLTTLQSLGWNAHFQSQLQDPALAGNAGRVSAEHIAAYALLTPGGQVLACAPATGPRPAVGDWVILDPAVDPTVNQARIVRTLRRWSAFVRARAGGGRAKAQVVAANVDVLFIVTSANADLSPRRVERYLTAAWDGGVTPVVVLNKVDLVDDPGPLLRSLQAVSPGVEVVASRALDPADDALRRHLGPGRTCALVGSSGVGKSTLANRLLGPARDSLAIGDIRQIDAKGRHTTTGRSLHVLPDDGGLVLDTPGMREFAMWFDDGDGDDDADGLDRAFPEVARLLGLGQCRFRDCQHAGEPGCSIAAAVGAGELSASRLDSYRKLGSERTIVHRRKTAEDRRESRRRSKALAREIRVRKRLKGR